jgi:hypothetical protein
MWIDDEVPDEIFELSDFKKAVIRRSKAHEMVETLRDSLDPQRATGHFASGDSLRDGLETEFAKPFLAIARG